MASPPPPRHRGIIMSGAGWRPAVLAGGDADGPAAGRAAPLLARVAVVDLQLLAAGAGKEDRHGKLLNERRRGDSAPPGLSGSSPGAGSARPCKQNATARL